MELRYSLVHANVKNNKIKVLIEKMVFNEAHEKIGVDGSHCGAHGHVIDLFK